MHHDRALRVREAPRLRVARALAGLAVAALTAGCGNAATVSPTATQVAPSRAAPPSPAVDAAVLAVLRQTWAGYKQTFIQGGRVLDPTRGGITTSEGQSYALLRAVWMDDRTTFDAVWHWTVSNLQVRGDALFASLWGSPDGVRDHNTASDADSDIALALLFAARTFNDSSYRSSAMRVLADMWRLDVAPIAGMNVLTGGNWATAEQSPGPVINPSYFSPYAYRVFAREDSAHPWTTLIDSSYTMLDRCTGATLDGAASAGLPPNWCAISRSTGQITSFPQISGADNYGYDAFRVMWRVAVDAVWNNEQRARDYLTRNDFLRTRWSSAQRIEAVYAHDGSVASGYEDPTIYGGDIGNFLVADPATARLIQQRLMTSFHAGPPAYFGDTNNYFEQNWVWFGLALSGGALTDLDGG